ncbi:MAG TPA: hypothetical protein VNE39_26215 [Planctomycetota bacterium]|nr:hypothetical protein [Planctomycetota bacterium]
MSAVGCWRRRVWAARHRPGPVVVTPPGPVVVAPPAAEIIVETPPPPPRVEVRPPCPVVGHVWCPGYWNWQGGRHVWAPGRWSPPPRRGAVWVAPRWEKGPRGWRHHPGLWR